MSITIDEDLLIGGPLTDIKLGAAGSEVSLGATLAGLVSRREVGQYREYVTQQSKGIIKKEEASGVRYFLATVLAHATLENLRIALNQASANLNGSTLTVDEDEMGVQSFIAEGPGPNGQTRYLEATRVISIATGEIVSVDQNTQQGFLLELEVLQDPSTKKWYQVRN